MSGVSKDPQTWIETRSRFHLSHAHVQMARELGMNPKKLGKLANHRQNHGRSASRSSSSTSIKYQKSSGKSRPDVVIPIEERARQPAAKKSARREARRRMEKQATGFAWFAPQQWETLRETWANRDSVGATHEEWLVKAENGDGRIGAAGATRKG